MNRSLWVAVFACLTMILAVFSLSGCSSNNDYTPQLKAPEVSTPVIGEAGVLRVGVDTDKTPLAGMGNDKIIGIDVDIAAAIADELGLKLSIVDVGTDPESALAENKVDIVMGIDASDTVNTFWVSHEYLPTGIALFALADSGLTLPGKQSLPQVSAQISSKSAWAVTNEYGEDSLVSATNLTEAFDLLESGKVSYVASDAVIGLYAAHRQEIDVTVVGLMERPTGYCIGINKNNADLQNTITQVLTTISDNGIIEVIEKKWLGQALDLSSLPQTEGAAAITNEGFQKATEDHVASGAEVGAEGNAEGEGSAEGDADASDATDTSSDASETTNTTDDASETEDSASAA